MRARYDASPGTVVFSYFLASVGYVKLDIYDACGSLTAELLGTVQGPGEHTVVWEGLDRSGQKAAQGVYFCRLRAGDLFRTVKFVITR
jgi:hypothetical protein